MKQGPSSDRLLVPPPEGSPLKASAPSLGNLELNRGPQKEKENKWDAAGGGSANGGLTLMKLKARFTTCCESNLPHLHRQKPTRVQGTGGTLTSDLWIPPGCLHRRGSSLRLPGGRSGGRYPIISFFLIYLCSAATAAPACTDRKPRG